jgi:hypothetical protein
MPKYDEDLGGIGKKIIFGQLGLVREFAHKILTREKIKSHEIPKIGLSVEAKNSSLVLLRIF